jgi:hypothetical protein
VERGAHVSEETSDDSKNKVYEELEQGFDHFPKYHRKLCYEILMQNPRREDILKPKLGMYVCGRIIMIMVLE